MILWLTTFLRYGIYPLTAFAMAVPPPSKAEPSTPDLHRYSVKLHMPHDIQVLKPEMWLIVIIHCPEEGCMGKYAPCGNLEGQEVQIASEGVFSNSAWLESVYWHSFFQSGSVLEITQGWIKSHLPARTLADKNWTWIDGFQHSHIWQKFRWLTAGRQF